MTAKTRFQIEASVTGMEGVKKLQNSIKQLQKSTLPTSLEITKLRTAAKALGSQSDLTENDLRTQISVFTELRASVSLTSQKYRLLTRDIQKAEAALAKAAATGKRGSMSFGKAAKGLGAVAGAGVFGGPEGAIGAGIGLAIGGPNAALAGGAIGAQVGMARRSIGETTEYSASLALQRKALKLVIADTNKYTEAQEFLSRKSKKLAIPQDVIVRQFTALTASVKGAGRSTEDAQKVFESIASGIRGTGGSLEDMKAAMTATAQVFSKGKVSAEELRQQLGERLPGAFTIFAESMGKTPAELDKALEQGKVTLDDFMKFSETLFAKYGKNAELLAAGPEAAGDRLAVSLTDLKDNLGELLTPIGAGFQDTFKIIVDIVNDAVTGIKEFLKIGEKFHQENLDRLESEKTIALEQLEILNKKKTADEAFINNIKAKVAEGKKLTSQENVQYNLTENRLIGTKVKLRELDSVLKKLDVDIAVIQEKMKDLATDSETAAKKAVTLWQSMKAGATAYKNSIIDINKQISDATKAAFTQMEDALVDFVMTGKLNFKEFASSVIADITRIFIRSQILGMFDFLGNKSGSDKGFKNVVSGSANGNVFGKNGIVPFAKGGIVDQPTFFPYANGGVGVMGEGGSPEAIIPLKRGRDGKLGVAGGGGTSVVVNVDASGSNVQGDEGNSAALGRAISSAVTEEIAKQKRPGGLLSPA
tara:strand:- start:162 stop:2276 length:2115 start_codon:yes stop_codon:yes gene_type:complete